MKKIIISIALALCAIAVQAQSIVYKTGSSSIFNEDITFNVIINDSNPVIDGKDQLAKDYYTAKSEQEYANFLQALDRGHESFITFYNENKGKIKSAIVHDEKAPYTLKVDVTSMNVGNGGGFAFGMTAKAGGALINGTMVLVNNESGEVVCEMQFTKIKGMLGPKFTMRAISVYRYLADAIIKSVK
jgi:hypothetical protein